MGQTTKSCERCTSSFLPGSHSTKYCVACRAAKRLEYRITSFRRRRATPEGLRRLREAQKRYLEKHRGELKIRRTLAYRNLRVLVLEHYGGKCVCCGETTREFLALDHKDGDGNKHRRSIGATKGGINILNWVVRNDYPKMIQLLCHNCNAAKGFYGQCPHSLQIVTHT